MDRHEVRALAGRRGFRRLLAAAWLARLGSEMWSVSVVLLVLDRTGSATLAGACLAGVTLPAVVMGPWWGGRLGRRALAGDQLVAAAALLALVGAAGHVPGAVLPLLALGAGLTFPLSTAGFSAVLPQVAGARGRPEANALDAGSYNVAAVAGPALAAGAAALGGPAAAVLLQVALKLAAWTACVRLPVAPHPRRDAPSIRAGLRHVGASRVLLAVMTTDTTAMVGRGLLAVGFPLFAAQSLGRPEAAAGWLWTSMALGAVVGTVLSPALQRRMAPARLALAGYGTAGLAMALWPLAPTLTAAAFVSAVAGACFGPSLSAVFAVRQAEAPGSMLAQVSLTGAGLKTAAFATGSALGGPLAEGAGAATSLLAAGALHAGAALAGTIVLARAHVGCRAAGLGDTAVQRSPRSARP